MAADPHRGSGSPWIRGTPALPRDATDFEGYAAWVGEFLSASGEEEPVLVMGHSFGGGIAIELSHDHPEQVRARVLINSIGESTWSRRVVTVSGAQSWLIADPDAFGEVLTNAVDIVRLAGGGAPENGNSGPTGGRTVSTG